MESICISVTDELNRRGVKASFEYPGFVYIPTDDNRAFVTSDCNDTWTVDLQTMDDENAVLWTEDTYIRRDCDNVGVIVDGILAIIARTR